MSKNPKFAIRVTEKRNGWSAEITRQVTSRKTMVSKRETGFDSEEKAQAWAEQELRASSKTKLFVMSVKLYSVKSVKQSNLRQKFAKKKLVKHAKLKLTKNNGIYSD